MEDTDNQHTIAELVKLLQQQEHAFLSVVNRSATDFQPASLSDVDHHLSFPKLYIVLYFVLVELYIVLSGWCWVLFCSPMFAGVGLYTILPI